MTDSPKPEFREYLTIAVDKIQVENTSGKITITPVTINKVEIWATKRKFSESCVFSTEKSDYSEILVKVARNAGDECEVDLELKVPKEAALNIVSGSGDVSIDGSEGKLNFNIGSGSLVANGKFKKVDGKSGNGSVEINGLTTGGNLSVGSGSVQLRYLEYPTGRLEVKTGAGSADIAFPKGSKITASLDTGSGKIENELGSSGSADFGLTVKTGSGDLKVKAY